MIVKMVHAWNDSTAGGNCASKCFMEISSGAATALCKHLIWSTLKVHIVYFVFLYFCICSVRTQHVIFFLLLLLFTVLNYGVLKEGSRHESIFEDTAYGARCFLGLMRSPINWEGSLHYFFILFLFPARPRKR